MCREILRVQNLSACSWFLSLTALWLRHPQKIGLLNYVCLLQLGSKKLGSIERGETNCSAWLIVQHDDIMLQDFKKIFGFFCAMLLSWVPPFSWLIFCAGPDKKTHSFEFLNFLSLSTGSSIWIWCIEASVKKGALVAGTGHTQELNLLMHANMTLLFKEGDRFLLGWDTHQVSDPSIL